MLSSSTPPPLHLSLLLFLLYHSPVLSCQTGNRSQCVFPPLALGHDLVGEGFDVVNMHLKGAYLVDMETVLTPHGTCTLCRNPNNDNRLEKLLVSGLDWRADSHCDADLSGSMHSSVGSMKDRYNSQKNRNARLSIDSLKSPRLGIKGTQSNMYEFASRKSGEDRYSFSVHTVTCTHYSYRMSDKPPLSPQFIKDLENLPGFYNSKTAEQYKKLIKTYGTHYVHQVNLGGRLRRVTAARTCLSTLNGLSMNEVHNCLSRGISIGLGKVSANYGSCSKVLQNRDYSTSYSSGLHQHYTEVVGGMDWSGEFSLTHEDSVGYKKWLSTLKHNPNVVSYSLRPIYEVVYNSTQKAGIKAAIEQYLNENPVRKSPSEPYCGGSTSYLASNCCPKEVSRGKLSVTILRAWNLDGDYLGCRPTDSYATLEYDSFEGRTPMIESDNPEWNAHFDLGTVNTGHNLRVKVWDEDWYDHDLLGSCYADVTRGSYIYTCSSDKGGFKFETTLTCEPYLTGDKCDRYTSSPR